MRKIRILIFVLIFIVAASVYQSLKPYDKSLSYAVSNVMFIRFALLDYAQKHHGSFPSGNSSTEVFQQLIDDHDLTAEYFYCELPGKNKGIGPKLCADTVCFDFTKGTSMSSPDWVPIVLPTGFSINYHTGEATMLSSSGLQDDFINVAYTKSMRSWSLNLFSILPIKSNRIFIMPGKPAAAKVDQYQLLTP